MGRFLVSYRFRIFRLPGLASLPDAHNNKNCWNNHDDNCLDYDNRPHHHVCRCWFDCLFWTHGTVWLCDPRSTKTCAVVGLVRKLCSFFDRDCWHIRLFCSDIVFQQIQANTHSSNQHMILHFDKDCSRNCLYSFDTGVLWTRAHIDTYSSWHSPSKSLHFDTECCHIRWHLFDTMFPWTRAHIDTCSGWHSHSMFLHYDTDCWRIRWYLFDTVFLWTQLHIDTYSCWHRQSMFLHFDTDCCRMCSQQSDTVLLQYIHNYGRGSIQHTFLHFDKDCWHNSSYLWWRCMWMFSAHNFPNPAIFLNGYQQSDKNGREEGRCRSLCRRLIFPNWSISIRICSIQSNISFPGLIVQQVAVHIFSSFGTSPVFHCFSHIRCTLQTSWQTRHGVRRSKCHREPFHCNVEHCIL